MTAYAVINIAKAQLGLDEVTDRALLVRVTGKDSLRAMNADQHRAVIDDLKRPAFKVAGRKVALAPSTKPYVRTIHALWKNCVRLGVIQNGSRPALRAFCKRFVAHGHETVTVDPRSAGLCPGWPDHRGAEEDGSARQGRSQAWFRVGGGPLMDKRIPASAIRRVWVDTALTTTQAAVQVGLSRSNLWLRARALGLPPRKAGQRSLGIADDPEFAAMWLAGVLIAAMAAHFGCHKFTICRLAREAGLPRRPLGRRIRVTLADFRKLQKLAAMRAMAERENTALKRRTR